MRSSNRRAHHWVSVVIRFWLAGMGGLLASAPCSEGVLDGSATAVTMAVGSQLPCST